MKTVGNRRTNFCKFEDYDELVNLLNALREAKFFVKKGVHKFKTFKEADTWMRETFIRTALQEFREPKT